jgi:glycosyltransferase involved in cell wall biosynthesis
MKIIVFSNTAWSLYNFRKGLIEALKKEGHQIFLLANKDSYEEKLKSLGKFRNIKLKQKGKNPFNEIKSFILIFIYIYATKPDYILTFTIKPNIYGAIVARILNIPVVVNITGLGDVFSSSTFLRYILTKIIKISLKKAKKIFFQNSTDMRFFKRLGINGKSVGLLPGSGINIKKYSYHPLEFKNIKQFLFVGRLLKNKGFYEYACAAELLKSKFDNIEFVAVGTLVEDNKKLIENILKKGIIQYHGQVDDVRPFLIKSDCVVLPSYYKEGTPRSLIEAAAIGRPIITTDRPGCRDMIIGEGINGFLCKSKDVYDLANQIQKIIEAPFEKLLEMGKSSRDLSVNKYNEIIVINEYMKVLN